MDNMRKTLAKALAFVAFFNRLKKDGNAYVSPEGARYVLTDLGFIPATQENLRRENERLTELIEELRLEKKSMMRTISYYHLYERELDTKAYIKIVRILNSRVSDSEKVKQIKKYLL